MDLADIIQIQQLQVMEVCVQHQRLQETRIQVLQLLRSTITIQEKPPQPPPRETRIPEQLEGLV